MLVQQKLIFEILKAPSSRYFSRRPTVGAGRILKRKDFYRKNSYFQNLMEFGDGPFDEKYFYRDTQRNACN